MKLNILNKLQAVSQNLLSKGPSAATAAIQQALGGARAASASATSATAAAQPVMRDINPPPAGKTVHVTATVVETPPALAPAEAQSATQGSTQGKAQATAQATAAPAAEAEAETSAAASPPNPATHPTEYAQDILNRMGIKVDPQANIDVGNSFLNGTHPGLTAFEMPKFDLSSLDIQGSPFGAPAAPGKNLPEGAQFITGTYKNHAGSRNYKLYIPSTYHGQAMPLLVMLHGCTQGPDDFAAGTQMNQVAEEQQCFVVYPEQTSGANQNKCWNWFSAIDQQRDQGEPSLIAGIAQQVIDGYPVNERQVYVAGLSAGGAMAVIVGTLYPDLFAAVGVHSGLPFASAQDLPSALTAMRRGASDSNITGAVKGSLPIIVFHGDQDHTVNPRNGEQVMEQGLHSVSGMVSPSVQSGSVPNGHSYTQTTHLKQDGQPHAEHWVVHGAGHAWSGGSTQGSYTDGKGPDASREMMRFFSTVS